MAAGPTTARTTTSKASNLRWTSPKEGQGRINEGTSNNRAHKAVLRDEVAYAIKHPIIREGQEKSPSNRDQIVNTHNVYGKSATGKLFTKNDYV